MPELHDELTSALADRYAIERQIGAGGMATVYLARDLKHDREVALKVLNPDLGAVLGVERFLAEIKVTANLQHPNLLPLFDSGEASPPGYRPGAGLLFYVMPFVDGESLRARLEREKQLPVDEALRIATAVASALDYAHRHGVIHRDLKPENILLHEGQPLVADFGIALAVSNAGGNRITQTGLSLGTPAYMSPEQATGDRVIDARTDVYSLGAVLYEMLTGEPPHVGNTAQAVIARVLTEKPRNIRSTRAAVPEHVEQSTERALEKLPADRWATAGQFADAINGKVVASPPSGVAAAQMSARSRGWRSRVADPIVAAFGALAIGGLAFGVWQWRESRREPDGVAVRFPLTLAAGDSDVPATQITISADGRTIVYIGRDASGERLLFIRRLDQLTSQALPGTKNPTEPSFSPNGDWITFFSEGQLKKVRIADGAVLSITPLSELGGTSWGPNDTIVISTRGRLMTVPATGGSLKPLSQPDTSRSERAQYGPVFLDDGKSILYQSYRGSVAESKLGIASIETGETQILDITGAVPLGDLDGHLIYQSSAGAIMAVPFDLERRRLTGDPVPLVTQVQTSARGVPFAAISSSGTLIYRAGFATARVVLANGRGATTTLIADPKQYSFPRFSPDGKRLAITIEGPGGSDVWIYDIASGVPTRLTNGGGTRNDRAEWSPDGKRVYFTSGRSGNTALWVQNADFSGDAELVESVTSRHWYAVDEGILSPDGSTLVLRGSTPGNPQDIWYRSLTGDTTRKPLVVSAAATEYAPRFSPDGKWIAYMSNQDGTNQIYVQPFPPVGARYQVTATGGSAPVWSRDGRRIYYQANNKLFAAAVTTKPAFAVQARDSLFEGNFNLSVPQHANYDLSPDGKHFVLIQPTESDARIIVVHGWKYELRERTRVKR